MTAAATIESGQRFGRLVAIGPAARDEGRRARWSFRCDCGAFTTVDVHSVKRGNTRSCGCAARALVSASRTTHGMRRSPEYRVWMGMKTRCTNPKSPSYARYGGAGITVCARWQAFEAFLADMGPRPTGTTIDRIDNARGYEPGNCRWATAEQQGSNKRSNHLVTYLGESLTIAQWSRRTGLTRDAIRQRLAAGWTVDRTLTQGPDPRRSTRSAASMEA